VIRALQRQESDRVPTFEWAIDRKVGKALTGSDEALGVIEALDIDGVAVRADYGKQRIDAESYVDEWGCRRKVSGESLDVIVASPIADIRRHAEYRFPDPQAPHRLASLQKAVEAMGAHRAVVFNLRDVFSDIRDLVGYENALIALLTDQQAFVELLERVIEYNRTLARIARDRFAVNIVATTDDIADGRGLVFSPQLYFSVLAPRMAEVIRGYKELGYYCIKHCDGNVDAVVDFWIKCGIDCLDPIDPQAGMNLAEVKAKYGDRIALKGNVDCAQLMTFGTPDQVIEATKEALRQGAPGGGFILSSSNSIHSAVKPENYQALLTTWQTYGQYPLRLS
jgi:uroporphyrinogen decarboxylase